MTLPRRVQPGVIQLVTRRVAGRMHLLRPDPDIVQLCRYLLGVYTERYCIHLHAVVFMANHVHLVLTDTLGCVPNFLRDFHRAMALGVKVLRQWHGSLWDHERTSRVELCTAEAVIEKLAYVVANPVSAGLVQRAEDWPGVTTLPHELGAKSWTTPRPNFFFDPDNHVWPPTATLRLIAPDGPWDIEEVRARVARELKYLESQALNRTLTKGIRALERSDIFQSSPFKRAATPEPQRHFKPVVAAGRGQQEAFRKAVQVLRSFRLAYRRALNQWREGNRGVLFPAATWLMRWLHVVQVEPS